MATGNEGAGALRTTEPIPPAVQDVNLGPIGPKDRYEFTPEQEKTIGDLAGKMGFVAAFLLAMATISLVQAGYVAYKARLFDWPLAINALIYGCIGVWTLNASGAFAAVVTTVGRDVTHLMNALGSLRRMYSLLYWLLIAGIVASIILMVTLSVRGG